MLHPVFTIPANLNFANTLAEDLLERYGANPLLLSSVLVLLPSRRACISLREAFLRASNGKPLLLPRLQPIGDVDENTLFAGLGDIKVPPPASDFQRLFILAKLLQAKDRSRMDHALKLAYALAGLLDELERENIPPETLISLPASSDVLAEHWQLTAEFLKILTEHLPDVLQQERIESSVAHRNHMLARLAAYWQENPPATPVIIAGITGSIPATATLVKVVSGLPHGAVFLPGFNPHTPETVAESHPQFGMRHLLDAMEYPPEKVMEAGSRKEGAGCRHRLQLMTALMETAETGESTVFQGLSADITQKAWDVKAAVKGLRRVDTANIQEEASVISLILRSVLETAGKTAALVTNDRTLALRVSAMMQRFGVEIDDSAGIPLSQTPAGSFLRLIAKVAEGGMSDTVTLLALLKHPFCTMGGERIRLLAETRHYEIRVARAKTLSANPSDDTNGDLIMRIREILSPLITAFAAIQQLNVLLALHLEAARLLAGEDWLSGREGESVQSLITEIESGAIDCAIIRDATTYSEVCTFLLSSRKFRPEYGTHPRLKILSPVEARMQAFDVIILGGLNEGCFPAAPSPDPWLNRAMRQQVGLPAPERAMGQEALDFYLLANAPEIYLTRSEKADGTPTTASRWLTKLEVLLSLADSTITDTTWLAIARNLDDSRTYTKTARPAPRPPLSARPKQLYVTEVETLLRNPYEIYARLILQLKPLPLLMREPEAADFGIALHQALEHFVRTSPDRLPDNAHTLLRECGEKAFTPLFHHDRVRVLWWLRFERIADYIMRLEYERRGRLQTIMTEIQGEMVLANLLMKGRADRVEANRDGTLTIVDYKTGILPLEADIASGLAPQLCLLALIMQDTQGKPVEGLEYWRLKGGRDAGETRRIAKEKVQGYLEVTRNGLVQLIEKYNNPDFAYLPLPLPERARPTDDYAHLARVKEWSI